MKGKKLDSRITQIKQFPKMLKYFVVILLKEFSWKSLAVCKESLHLNASSSYILPSTKGWQLGFNELLGSVWSPSRRLWLTSKHLMERTVNFHNFLY